MTAYVMRISDWSSDVCSPDLQLGRADFDDFDWLLCADHANLRDVQALGPDSGRARSALFMEWAGLEGPIPDPYTGGDEHFEQVWAQVDEAARSEEHTSELQSLMRISYAVFCLKKINTITQQTHKT